jgi:hypothetical protein
MNIKYKSDSSGRCYTMCPFGKGNWFFSRVGSTSCQECAYFHSKANKEVICNYDKGANK